MNCDRQCSQNYLKIASLTYLILGHFSKIKDFLDKILLYEAGHNFVKYFDRFVGSEVSTKNVFEIYWPIAFILCSICVFTKFLWSFHAKIKWILKNDVIPKCVKIGMLLQKGFQPAFPTSIIEILDLTFVSTVEYL